MNKDVISLEFSKKLVVIILIIFGISMIASYTLPAFIQYMNELCIGIFQIVATLTGSTLVAYFGKAGFENYDKNKRKFGFEQVVTTQETESDEAEGGAG